MTHYFALFIKYLTERGKLITNAVTEKIAEYSNEFEQHFSVRRFIETAAFLKFQVDIIYDFAIWCGLSDCEIQQLINTLNASILSVVTSNQAEGTKISPVKQILLALWQNFNSSNNTLIAESEDVYVRNEPKYLGFYENDKGLLWLKATDSYKFGVEHLKKQGVNFLVHWDTLKKSYLPKAIRKAYYLLTVKADSI